MIPWELLDEAPVPGGGMLRLKRRGSEFSIMLDAAELMNSRRSGSEEALAGLACERLGPAHRPRMLIGGLGMGFTLRSALARLGPAAEIVVAELVPVVVTWARGPLAGVFAGCLDDPRVTVRTGDVSGVMTEPGGWDAILLDVDNGPRGLVRAENDALYAATGLAAAHAALRPGGLLAVWSSDPDDDFTRRLRQARFTVEQVSARTRLGKEGGRGARHVIWLARRD